MHSWYGAEKRVHNNLQVHITLLHQYNVKSYHLNCLNNSQGLSVKGQQTIPHLAVIKILLQNYSTTS